MSSIKVLLSLGLMILAPMVEGHGAIIKAVGDAGGLGMALGIDSSTPRDGTRRRPFQQDSTRFRGDQADTIGETLGGGNNDIEQGTRAILDETGEDLPQITQGGSLQLTLHQVNADGGGPYECQINPDGTGNGWEDLQVTTSPPGRNSRNRQGAATDFPLVTAIPDDQTCTGTVAGSSDICLVRCMNAARAGPFGGVVPVQMAGSSNSTSTATKRHATESQRIAKRAENEYEEDEAEEEECDDE
ncbi:hypothetical protein F5X98DRAFT_256540 [Xylaria grammica]|nr:hypothetical protein F5X98DRAFT_256540 [Xylaria grammica]